MFIVMAITNHSKLCRSEIKAPITLRSYGAMKRNTVSVYKHFIPTGLLCLRDFVQKTRSSALVSGRTTVHAQRKTN